MPTIHFLNVKEGDCSIIQHSSGNVTVVDVCNARPNDALAELLSAQTAVYDKGISGNFQQKKYPVNPISYLKSHQLTSVFRYIQTHPDMDHMDGIEALFNEVNPTNFWDTNNTKEMPSSNWQGSPYSEHDWKSYKALRDAKPESNPKRLALTSGASGKFYNVGADGAGGGDGLHVLAPTDALVDAANEAADDYHRCSYVILYRTGGNKIVFGGDSHDETWAHILEHHKSSVTNVDLLVAPHHGRKSGRSYKFLDTLTPTLTFFGNARAEHLAYSAWSDRGLATITNNQANCMVVDASTTPMVLYVTHGKFAQRVNPDTYYDESFKAWHVGPITKDLLS